MKKKRKGEKGSFIDSDRYFREIYSFVRSCCYAWKIIAFLSQIIIIDRYIVPLRNFFFGVFLITSELTRWILFFPPIFNRS